MVVASSILSGHTMSRHWFWWHLGAGCPRVACFLRLEFCPVDHFKHAVEGQQLRSCFKWLWLNNMVPVQLGPMPLMIFVGYLTIHLQWYRMLIKSQVQVVGKTTSSSRMIKNYHNVWGPKTWRNRLWHSKLFARSIGKFSRCCIFIHFPHLPRPSCTQPLEPVTWRFPWQTPFCRN